MKWRVTMDYATFRTQFFNSLNEDVKREMNSYYKLDIEVELERICKEEFEFRKQSLENMK
jgi:hypothetical protein